MKKIVLLFTSFLVLFSINAYADAYVDQITYSQSFPTSYTVQGDIAVYDSNGGRKICEFKTDLPINGEAKYSSCPFQPDDQIKYIAKFSIIVDDLGSRIFSRMVMVVNKNNQLIQATQIKRSEPLAITYQSPSGLAYWKAGEISPPKTELALISN